MAQINKRLQKATEVEQCTLETAVRKDAGGYPYIPAIELYDYDKDMPLANEGDEVIVQIRKRNNYDARK